MVGSGLRTRWRFVGLRDGIGGFGLGLARRFGVGWVDIMYMTEFVGCSIRVSRLLFYSSDQQCFWRLGDTMADRIGSGSTLSGLVIIRD